MKKGLLTTSALVAAGLIGMASDADAQGRGQPAVQLQVGGYMEQFIGYAFRRPGAAVTGGPVGTVDQQTEAEVHFTGNATLDNGLQIRAHIEYEVTGSPGNVIDEQYLILRNGFGQVILGNEDPVSALMTTGYMTTFVTNAAGSLTYDVRPWMPAPVGFGAPGSPQKAALNDPKLESYDTDANKMTYVSPRIAGFQVGVSYAPEAAQQLQTGTPAGSGLTRTLPSHSAWHDGWAFGANYTMKIDQVGIGVAAGYGTAHHGAGTTPGVNDTDPSQFGTGVRIDYGPFRAVFGYKRVWNMNSGNGGGTAGVLNNADGKLYNVGGIYRWGPNAVSLTWQKGTEEGSLATPGDDEQTMMMAAYSRALAPGVSARAYLAYADYDGEGATTDFSGLAAITSVRLTF